MALGSKFQKVYLFEGSDDGKKENAINDLARSLLDPESQDFDYEVIDGSSDTATAGRIISAARILPFSSRARVVLVRRVSRMPESEQRALAENLSRLPDSTCLILAASAPEPGDGRRSKKGSTLARELISAVRKTGEICRFDPPKKAEAASLARELLRAEGKEARSEALKLLTTRAGSEYSILKSEIEKLVEYTGERREITAADVQAVTSETVEEVIFGLIDAIGERDEARALELVRRYLDNADRPQSAIPRLISMIARQLRFLWQLKVIEEAGIRLPPTGSLPSSVIDMLPRKNNILDLICRQKDWQTNRILRQAQRFDRALLYRAFQLVADADLALKGVDDRIDDERTIIELLVHRLCQG